MENKFTVPDDIQEEAKAYMQNVCDVLEAKGVMENVDTAALNMLARNYSMFIQATKQIEAEGITITTERGNIAAHPAIKIAKDAQTSAVKIMLEFGLTAKARTKLSKMATPDEDSPLEAFVKNAKTEVR